MVGGTSIKAALAVDAIEKLLVRIIESVSNNETGQDTRPITGIIEKRIRLWIKPRQESRVRQESFPVMKPT